MHESDTQTDTQTNRESDTDTAHSHGVARLRFEHRLVGLLFGLVRSALFVRHVLRKKYV